MVRTGKSINEKFHFQLSWTKGHITERTLPLGWHGRYCHILLTSLLTRLSVVADASHFKRCRVERVGVEETFRKCKLE